MFTLFAQRLLNNSLKDTFFQTPLLDDWSISFHNKSSVCELSAALCTALQTAIFTAPKAVKMNLHFHSDQRKKTKKWADNMLIFNVDVNMKLLGIHFKNDFFFWETITLYMVHFQV